MELYTALPGIRINAPVALHAGAVPCYVGLTFCLNKRPLFAPAQLSSPAAPHTPSLTTAIGPHFLPSCMVSAPGHAPRCSGYNVQTFSHQTFLEITWMRFCFSPAHTPHTASPASLTLQALLSTYGTPDIVSGALGGPGPGQPCCAKKKDNAGGCTPLASGFAKNSRVSAGRACEP